MAEEVQPRIARDRYGHSQLFRRNREPLGGSNAAWAMKIPKYRVTGGPHMRKTVIKTRRPYRASLHRCSWYEEPICQWKSAGLSEESDGIRRGEDDRW